MNEQNELTDERLAEIVKGVEVLGVNALSFPELVRLAYGLQAAREANTLLRDEIAEFKALPPRMVEGVIRPVYPIRAEDYD